MSARTEVIVNSNGAPWLRGQWETESADGGMFVGTRIADGTSVRTALSKAVEGRTFTRRLRPPVTLDTLPTTGTLYLHVTAERHTEESMEHGDAAERGWVREPFNREIYAERDDAGPWLKFELPLTEDEHDEITREVDNLGHIDARERGTLYLGGMHEDYVTGDTFTFAVHAHVQHTTGGFYTTDVAL